MRRCAAAALLRAREDQSHQLIDQSSQAEKGRLQIYLLTYSALRTTFNHGR